MFRKLTNKISQAATAATSALTGGGATNQQEQQQASDSSGADVERLVAMGFQRGPATQALEATHGNVDAAAELLLSEQQARQYQPSEQAQQTRHTTAARTAPAARRQNQEEEDLRRAKQASLEDTMTAPQKQQNQPQPQKQRTAAMHKAAQAAEARQNGLAPQQNLKLSTAGAALAVTHPGVKVVPKLQDKSVEEQILRCADRVKSSPAAVDTLYKALTMIQQHPDDNKYRTIDTSTPGFQRSLAPAPGAMDFLKAMNFQSIGTKLVLSHAALDPARLYLGLSALEQIKLSAEYTTAKQRIAFATEIQKLRAGADHSEAEAIARAGFMAQCPAEPAQGRGAWMQVALAAPTPSNNNHGNNDNNGTAADNLTIRRRFDADDTLQDVLFWIASHLGAVVLERLAAREWMLVDVHRHPSQPLNCDKHASATLQYLGCWPSGKLELLPASDEWKQQQQGISVGGHGGIDVVGSARGLGAAPRDAL